MSSSGKIMDQYGTLIDSDKLIHQNKIYKIDKDTLQAYLFVDNPNEYESVRNYGLLEWYLDKDAIGKAIDIEKEYYFDPKPMEGPIEDRVRRACELMQNPMMRMPFISKITNLQPLKLYYIWMRDKWNEISSEYVFPIRNHSNLMRYKMDQIHEVCSLLSTDKSLRYKLIEHLTGVNTYTIQSVRFRKSYEMISMFYEFNPEEISNTRVDQSICSRQQVLQACYMLEDPSYTFKFIAEFCKMTLAMLYKIRDHKSWTNISKDFNMEVPRYRDQVRPYLYRVVQLLKQEYPVSDIIGKIQLEYKIPTRKQAYDIITQINKEYFNVTGSTTILEDEVKAPSGSEI